jgi:hypothetical protein
LRQLHFYQLSFSNFLRTPKVGALGLAISISCSLCLPAPLSDAVIHLSLLGFISARGQKNEVGRRNVFTSGAVFSFRRGGARTIPRKQAIGTRTGISSFIWRAYMLRVFGVVIGIAPLLTPIYISTRNPSQPEIDEIETTFFWKGRIEEEHGCFFGSIQMSQLPSKFRNYYIRKYQ